MGFFSSLFGGNKKSEQPALQMQNPVQKRAGEELYFRLIDMLVPLVPVREKLKKQITKAFEEPQSFYNDSSKYTLAIRGLYFPKHADVTPKYVFVDTMIEEELMVEVDWKEDESEIRRQIRAMIKAKQFSFSFLEEDRYENFDTDAVIQMINDEELMPKGYWLQILDIQSDCYVFTIVPAKERKKIAQMFSEL